MRIPLKRILVWLTGIAMLLSIPLIAMQFSTEVQWQLSDFLIMAIALGVLGLSYEWIARRSDKLKYRIAFALALAGLFLLFWVNAAVGIIGNEAQPANLLYGLVFITGISGGVISKFKAPGLAKTTAAMALVQMMVPVMALFIWPPPETSWSPGIPGVFALSAFFALLFLIAALLFRQTDS